MARSDYMPGPDAGKDELFTYNKGRLPHYFDTLEIDAVTSEVVTQGVDADAFHYALVSQQAILAAAQAAGMAKHFLLEGNPAAPNLPVGIVFPEPSVALPPVAKPGVEARFRAYARWIKSLEKYQDPIGEDLRIIGEEESPVDLATVKPVLPLGFMGMAVFIDWRWNGLAGEVDSLLIEVDRGAGYGFLTIDTTPGYLDTTPFPTPAGMWKYRGIYRKGDQTVGLMSDIAQIAVG